MNVRPQTLQELLTRFSGTLLNEQEISSYHKFSLRLFSNPKIFSNPRIEFTSQMDITEIHKNYENNYKNITNPPATFTAFFKWVLLKAMHSTPFNWRYINNQWYQFDNLPLNVAIRTSDKREQDSSFLCDIVDNSWENFCKKHASIGPTSSRLEEVTEFESILYSVCHQIERLHIPRMTDYRTTIRAVDIESHRPSIVFSDPYPLENRLYLPIHFSISHATLRPKLAEDFLKKLTMFANKAPKEVEIVYKSFSVLEKSQPDFINRAKL